ncbi:MAG: CpaD family pilus assembly protein [Pseudomonadota bacterium]
MSAGLTRARAGRTVRGKAAILASVAMAVMVAACAKDERPIGTIPLSYEDRHPIAVGYYPEVLDVALDGQVATLHPGDRTAVYGFVRRYRNEGESALHVHLPAGSGNEHGSQAIAHEIREIARQEGIPGNLVVVQTYHAGGRAVAPIRLSFSKLQAEASQCGFFPSDISGDHQNRDYENFACAQQNNLAAMLDDPRDLLGPRGNVPRDSERRRDMFDKWRTAQDTSTQYQDANEASASEVGE